MFNSTVIYVILFTLSHVHADKNVTCPTKCTCHRTNGKCHNMLMAFIPPFPNTITRLDFSGNNLIYINSRKFYNIFDLNITYLNLGNNSVHRIRQGSFSVFPFIKELILRHNKLAHVPNFCSKNDSMVFRYLTIIDLGYNCISSLYTADGKHGAFEGECLPRLKEIYLDHNDIDYIPDNVFSYIPMLHLLNLMNQETSVIQFAPLAFNSSYLQHLDISNIIHHFYRHNNITTFFQGCPELNVLKMNRIRLETSNGDILKTLLSPLTKLKSLSLEYSFVKTLPSALFDLMPHIEMLDLRYCKLSSWGDQTFKNLSELRRLNLEGNSITLINRSSLPMEVLSNLKYMDLSYNPLACTCESLWFLKHMESNYVQFKSYYSNYMCNSPQQWKGKFVYLYHPTYLECHPMSPYIVMAISITSAMLLVSLIGMIIYRFRWDIRYNIYLSRTRKKQGYARLSSIDQFAYDAFVAYSNEERWWVISELVPKIEDKEHFKLCLHDRNFIPGKFIIDNICDEIKNSKKTMIVLSNDFAKSQWCQLELTLAQQRHIEDENNHLIVIMMGDIKAKNMSNSLRVLLNSTTYIPWTNEVTGRELFWDRLKGALYS